MINSLFPCALCTVRYWRHYGPVPKSRLFPGSLSQNRRPSFLHDYFKALQTIVSHNLWYCNTYC